MNVAKIRRLLNAWAMRREHQNRLVQQLMDLKHETDRMEGHIQHALDMRSKGLGPEHYAELLTRPHAEHKDLWFDAEAARQVLANRSHIAAMQTEVQELRRINDAEARWACRLREFAIQHGVNL